MTSTPTEKAKEALLAIASEADPYELFLAVDIAKDDLGIAPEDEFDYQAQSISDRILRILRKVPAEERDELREWLKSESDFAVWRDFRSDAPDDNDTGPHHLTHLKYIGRRFGKLVVKEYYPSYRTNGAKVNAKALCVCDCGKEAMVQTVALLSRQTISCGCYRTDGARWIGEKFNRLTILEYFTGTRKRKARVRCRCDCGKELTAFLCNVSAGSTKSCGCLKEAMKPVYARRLAAMNPSDRYIGQRKGSLVVVKRTGTDNHSKIIFLVRCDCGNEFEQTAQNWKIRKKLTCSAACPI